MTLDERDEIAKFGQVRQDPMKNRERKQEEIVNKCRHDEFLVDAMSGEVFDETQAERLWNLMVNWVPRMVSIKSGEPKVGE